MSNYFLEIQKGNFVASEKNKVNNVNLKIENQGEIISLLRSFRNRKDNNPKNIGWSYKN